MGPAKSESPHRITVHCFLHFCPHVVNAASVQAAHDEMEEHYRDRHAELIRRRLVGCLR